MHNPFARSEDVVRSGPPAFAGNLQALTIRRADANRFNDDIAVSHSRKAAANRAPTVPVDVTIKIGNCQ